MTSIFNYLKKMVTTQQRPDSPISDAIPPDPRVPDPIVDCGNMACLEHTLETTKWKLVYLNQSPVWFCSNRCWHEWLDTPSQIGCWPAPKTESKKY